MRSVRGLFGAFLGLLLLVGLVGAAGGYMAFQQQASELITGGLRSGARHTTLVDRLNQLFAQSLAA